HVARTCGATGTVIVRGDSGCYSAKLITALAKAGAVFSITARWSRALARAITTIDQDAWTHIEYDTPVLDQDTGQTIHTAQIAATRHTAFTNPTQNPGRRTTATLVVRRHRVLTVTEQGELFPAWRYQAIFTNSPFDPITVEAQHRGRAGAIEQVFADLNGSALTHFPSGRFAANAAWLTLAALAHNLQRAIGCLAGEAHAKARTTTLRARLITVAARVSHTARTITLHLPRNWPWQQAWQRAFTHAHAPPRAV
ncbi:transposase, partial [Kutzneria sp. NPDC052558]|uniref:transposase n=1 Tax=Kutzneria sp. NPDC052558 TaxID=3364121 RepID=UPI0037C778F0